MFDSPGNVALVITGVAVMVVVRYFVFRASCSLAEAGEPATTRSLALVIGVLALSAGLVLLASYLVPVATESSGGGRLLAQITAFVAGALVAVLLYSPLLPTTLRRAALLAATELLLGSLIAALVAGIVFVVLAGVQLSRRPLPPRVSIIVAPVTNSRCA